MRAPTWRLILAGPSMVHMANPSASYSPKSWALHDLTKQVLLAELAGYNGTL